MVFTCVRGIQTSRDLYVTKRSDVLDTCVPGESSLTEEVQGGDMRSGYDYGSVGSSESKHS